MGIASITVTRHDTPVGPLWSEVSAAGLHRLSFAPPEVKRSDSSLDSVAKNDLPVGAAVRVLDVLREQLAGYFAGETKGFSVLLVETGTAFQRRVWGALGEIPHGQTWSYRQLAAHLGKPAAVRAVGRANGMNPWPILRPCHRVIGSGGSLTGYAGGLAMKRQLLELEGALPAALFAG